MAAVSSSSSAGAVEAFAPMSARRLLLLGGIGLILVGMIFGDIFAVFVLHQNAARVAENLAASAHAVLAGDAAAAQAHFGKAGEFLENRGTKVDTHVHMIAFGYLALMLAVLQPWIALTESAKKRLAWVFLIGAGLLPVCVFLIHYAGLLYSPLESIGCASILADFGGLLVILATLGYLIGLYKDFSNDAKPAVPDALLADRGQAGRWLFSGGVFLALFGLLFGAYYAAADLYNHEKLDHALLSRMNEGAAERNAAAVDSALNQYGQLQGDKAVKIAAHAHVIEFGILAILLAFFQPYVSLSNRWKKTWAAVLLFGGWMLPVFVLQEIRWGLLAGAMADMGGLLVIIALLAMWIGILRYTGQIDAVAGGTR